MIEKPTETAQDISTPEAKPQRLSDLPLLAELIPGGPITAEEQALLETLRRTRDSSRLLTRETETAQDISTPEAKPQRLSDLPLLAELIPGGPITKDERTLWESLRVPEESRSSWRKDDPFEDDGSGPRGGQ